MPTKRVEIEGGIQDSDVGRLRHALGEVWGIEQVDIDAAAGQVTFTYDERAGSLQDFMQAIESSGFAVRGQQGGR